MKTNLREMIRVHIEKHNQFANQYPNRHREIHKVPCLNCPSVVNKKLSIVDPEMEDILTLDRSVHIESVFVCGWRGSKLCKGYCDVLNITEDDLPK